MNILKTIIILPFLAYVFSMLIYPWVISGYSWDYLQSVWQNWQSLNAGFLATIAAGTVIWTTRLIINQNRRTHTAEYMGSAFIYPEYQAERKLMIKVMRDWKKPKDQWDYDPVTLDFWDLKTFHATMNILTRYETIALSIKHKTMDDKIVFDFVERMFLSDYEMLQPLFNAIPKIYPDDDTAFIGYRILCERWKTNLKAGENTN